MNKETAISFLEETFGVFEVSEEKIKELTLKISSVNDEIKSLRTFRDSLKEERDKIQEECKSRAIDLQKVSEVLVKSPINEENP